AGERKDTMPVAGEFAGAADKVSIQRDYPHLASTQEFWSDGTGSRRQEYIMPFYLTLARFSGKEWDDQSWGGMLDAAGSRAGAVTGGVAMEYFQCPGDKTTEPGNMDHAGVTLFFGAPTASNWAQHPRVPEMTSYVFSEYLLGS